MRESAVRSSAGASSSSARITSVFLTTGDVIMIMTVGMAVMRRTAPTPPARQASSALPGYSVPSLPAAMLTWLLLLLLAIKTGWTCKQKLCVACFNCFYSTFFKHFLPSGEDEYSSCGQRARFGEVDEVD